MIRGVYWIKTPKKNQESYPHFQQNTYSDEKSGETPDYVPQIERCDLYRCEQSKTHLEQILRFEY